jgi:hypothetical protein
MMIILLLPGVGDVGKDLVMQYGTAFIAVWQCINNQSRSPWRQWQFCAHSWRWAVGRLMAAVPRKLTCQLQTEMQTAYTSIEPTTHHSPPPIKPHTAARSHVRQADLGNACSKLFCVNYLIHSAPLRSTLPLHNLPSCRCWCTNTRVVQRNASPGHV